MDDTIFDEANGFVVICPKCTKQFTLSDNLEKDVGACDSDPYGPDELTCPHCNYKAEI